MIVKYKCWVFKENATILGKAFSARAEIGSKLSKIVFFKRQIANNMKRTKY